MAEANAFLKGKPAHGDDAPIEAKGRVYVGLYCSVCDQAVPYSFFDQQHTH